jgi:hypothetical protein
MTTATRSPLPLDWRDLASLGEQIVSATSLSSQRDQIMSMTSRLMSGEVEVWLKEHLFRLPNIEGELLFPEEPDTAGMQRALKLGRVCTKQKRGTKTNASRGTWASVPLEEQGITLGALQVNRPTGPDCQEELNHAGIGGVIAVSWSPLTAWSSVFDLIN